jgi:hypothetical protein
VRIGLSDPELPRSGLVQPPLLLWARIGQGNLIVDLAYLMLQGRSSIFSRLSTAHRAKIAPAETTSHESTERHFESVSFQERLHSILLWRRARTNRSGLGGEPSQLSAILFA